MFHKQIIKDGDVTNVVKEILVDGQEYVDEKPREGSVNSVTSGGVAKALGEVVGGSETAPTTGTRPSVEDDFVNKLIVVDGKVAKITDVQDGTTTYVTTDIVDELNAMQWKDVTVPPIMEGPYTITVHDKENVSVPYIAGDNIDLLIQCDETCRNARLRIQKQPSNLRSLTVKRGNNTEVVFGKKTLIDITYDIDYAIQSCLVSELGCDAQVPTDFSDVGLYDGNPFVSSIEKARSLNSDDTLFAIEITPLYAKLLVL